jgi:hypothetical protein
MQTPDNQLCQNSPEIDSDFHTLQTTSQLSDIPAPAPESETPPNEEKEREVAKKELELKLKSHRR